MIRTLLRPRRLFRRLLRREDGNASIEFVMFVPVVLTVFMASVEAGWFTMRSVMLERGLDLVMRDFRLGRLAPVDHDEVRDLICDASPFLPNCTAELKVWIEPINAATWTMPPLPSYCGDGNGSLTKQDTGNVVSGGSNEIVLVHVCTLAQPFFPTTGIGLQLRADSVTGDYQITAATVAVNEPR